MNTASYAERGRTTGTRLPRFPQPLPPLQGIEGDRRPRTLIDAAVYLFFFFICVFQLTHYLHTTDFMNDITYPDLARSIFDHHSYQLRLMTETTFPPGFPLLLAAVGLFLGFSPGVMFGVVAVSAMLGLAATYELLRRVEGPAAAAAISLLLASCPAFFGFNTSIVFAETPYLLMCMVSLLLVVSIDRSERAEFPFGRVLALGITLAAAVMIRSVGVALLAGLATWIAASFVVSPESGRRRMNRFLISLALGLIVQIGWMAWANRHQVLEWQLPGYPQSYLEQLKVKNGHDPELGVATVSDLPARIGHNLIMRTAGFSQLFLRRNIAKFWSSPAIIGVLLLIGIGLWTSLRNGGQLFDWYFLWHEIIFLLWPWDYRDRFLLPVVPLACLYLWRGAKAIKEYLIRQPQKAGAWISTIGAILCVSSAAFAMGVAKLPTNPEHIHGDRVQAVAATLFWDAVAVAGLFLLNVTWLRRLRDSKEIFGGIGRALESIAPQATRVAAIAVVALMVFSGTRQILAIGRYNLRPDITTQPFYPMMKAADWMLAHEPPDRVFMVREPDYLFHLTGHRTVWFPPISDPRVLMDGIQRYHVGAILIIHQEHSYWLPSEEQCFQALQKAYPGAFELTHSDVNSRLYEVVSSHGG